MIEPSSRLFIASVRARALDLEAVMRDLESLGLGRADDTRERIGELRRLADDFEFNELAFHGAVSDTPK